MFPIPYVPGREYGIALPPPSACRKAVDASVPQPAHTHPLVMCLSVPRIPRKEPPCQTVPMNVCAYRDAGVKKRTWYQPGPGSQKIILRRLRTVPARTGPQYPEVHRRDARINLIRHRMISSTTLVPLHHPDHIKRGLTHEPKGILFQLERIKD